MFASPRYNQKFNDRQTIDIMCAIGLLWVLGVLVDGDLIIGILGVVISLWTFGFTIVRVLDKKAEDRQTRLEKRHIAEMTTIRQEIADKHHNTTREIQSIHGRVSEVKDQYVKQDSHDRDINRIHTSITEFRSEIKTEITGGMSTFNASIRDLQKDFTALLMDISSKVGKTHD